MRIFGVEVNVGATHDKLVEALADLERKLEDIGWVAVGGEDSGSHTAARESYDKMVKRSRLAFIKNPLVSQAVQLTTSYTFGEGIQKPKAADSSNTEIQEIIDRFWSHPDNRISFTSESVQLKLSNKLQYDGELGFVLQVDLDGSVYVRLIDTLSITEIIYDPSDSMRPLFYKRKKGLNKNEYIPDWQNGLAFMRDDASYGTMWTAMLNTLKIKPEEVLPNSYLYHVRVNNDILDRRGVPEVYRALDWINANSKINADTATFINAQSQYAWKKKVKGTRTQVDAIRGRLQQNTQLTNPSRMAGSTIVQNDLIENEPIGLPSSTGQLFEIGIRRTLLMVCASFGIMEHYFGDPSTGNLATAEAMELPMLKKFLARQKFWEGVYWDVLNFVFDMQLMAVSTEAFDYNEMKNRLMVREGRDYADRTVDIDFPPILEKNVSEMASALSSAKRAQLIPTETAQRLFLQSLGVNNIDEELQKEFEEPQVPAFPGFGAANESVGTYKGWRLMEYVRRVGGKWYVYSHAGKKLGGPYGSKEEAAKRLSQVEHFKNREAVATADITDRREGAVRLSDKNKEVLRRMNGYLKAIAGEYKKFRENVKGTFHFSEDSKQAEVKGLTEAVRAFEQGMLRQGKRYIPIAVELGEKYVKSRIAVRESFAILREQELREFTEEQIAWNKRYVEESLGTDIEAKFLKLKGKKYGSLAEMQDEIEDTVRSFERRVASYAGAFWTIEERSVKFAGKDLDRKANFVGVEDRDNCPGCARGIDGNPWTLESVPVPGDQDCLTNCRHAVQLIDDEPLSEADIQLLKESEKQFKDGPKLLDMEIVTDDSD